MPARQTRKSKMPQKQSADSRPRSESLSSSQGIVGRLRTATGLDLDLKREAADEIERLRMTPDELHCLQQILLVNHVKCLDPLREFMKRQVSPQENSTADGKGFSRAGKGDTEGPRCGSKCTGRDSGSPTLTDAEREAVEASARIIEAYEEDMDGFPSGASATLRGLLERLGVKR